MDTNQFEQFLHNKFQTIDFSPIYRDIETLIEASIARNFKEGGRFGNEKFGGGTNKWKPSLRSIKQSGETLRDKGILRNSISAEVKQVGNSLQVTLKAGTNYAAIHNFGGVISRRTSTTKMSARPFFVLQDEDVSEIQKMVLEFVIGKLGGI